MNICVPIQIYIDGKFMESKSGRRMDTIDPSDESVICTVPKVKSMKIELLLK